MYDRPEKILTVAWYDLSEHHFLGVVWLAINAALSPLEKTAITRCTVDILMTPCALVCFRPITVEADDIAAFSTYPMNVEEGCVAHIAHLSHAIYGSLPGNVTCNARNIF